MLLKRNNSNLLLFADQCKILVHTDEPITEGREGGGLRLNGTLKDEIIQFVNQNY